MLLCKIQNTPDKIATTLSMPHIALNISLRVATPILACSKLLYILNANSIFDLDVNHTYFNCTNALF